MLTAPVSETARTASRLQFTGKFNSNVLPARSIAHPAERATGFSPMTQNMSVVVVILTRPRLSFGPTVLVLVLAWIEYDGIATL